MFTDKWTLDLPVDQVYTLALVTGLVLAFVVPHVPHGKPRAAFTSIVGAFILLVLSGIEISHWIVVSAISFALCQLLYKTPYCGHAVFIIAFGYQGVVRYCDLYDIYKLGDAANTVMLMQALKVVAFAYDCQKNATVPGFNNFVHYLLFFPGIWSGPYLSFNDVLDTLSRDYSVQPKPNQVGFVAYRIACSIWYIVHFVWFRFTFTTESLLSKEFGEMNVFMQMIWTQLVIIGFRSRLCTAWTIADATCGAAGVCYDESYKFKIDESKVWNVNCFEVECAPSLQHEIRNWNRSVQTWMATYPYKFSPFSSRVMRQIYTMSVSAYWHGLNSGYYLSFSLFPIFQAAQEVVFNQPLPGERSSAAARTFWDVVRRVMTGILMSYNIIPFVFLTVEGSVTAWTNMRFYGFWILAILFVIGAATTKRRRKYRKIAKQEKEAALAAKNAAAAPASDAAPPVKAEETVKEETVTKRK